MQLAGKLQLDAGAVRALKSDGKSLLPIGVVAVEGAFDRGEVVGCYAPDGREVARGLVNYSAQDAAKILRRPSSEIEAILGYVDEAELIHRDNLVLLLGPRVSGRRCAARASAQTARSAAGLDGANAAMRIIGTDAISPEAPDAHDRPPGPDRRPRPVARAGGRRADAARHVGAVDDGRPGRQAGRRRPPGANASRRRTSTTARRRCRVPTAPAR